MKHCLLYTGADIQRRQKGILCRRGFYLLLSFYGVQVRLSSSGPNHWWLGVSTYNLIQ